MTVRTTNSLDDRALLHAVAARDRNAFRELYDRHAATLLGLALKILSNRADAEDVLQEAFIQVWKNAATFDEGRGTTYGWLIMLTRSRAIDRLRARESRVRAIEAAAQEETDWYPEEPAQHAMASELHGIVRSTLDALPEEQRGLIELAYFGGLTQTEIAQRVGQPLGTVKTRLRAGMQRLREQLGAVPREDIKP